MTTIDGLEIEEISVDGAVIEEVTVGGDVVWTLDELEVWESFTHNDLQGEYSGETSGWEIQTNTYIDQGYALSNDPAENAGWDTSHPIHSDEIEGPSRGENFKYNVQSDNWASGPTMSIMAFAVTDEDNQYYVQIYTESDEITLNKLDGGNASELLNLNVDMSTWQGMENEWLQVEVDWDSGGDMDLRLLDSDDNEVVSGSTTDSTYNSGNIGFAYRFDDSSNDEMWFDYIAEQGAEEQEPEQYTTIESFEDSNWLDDWNDSGNVQFDRIDSNPDPVDGDWAVQSGDGDFSRVSSLSGEGLSDYPSKGDDFHFNVHIGDSDDRIFFHPFVQDHNFENFYRVTIHADDNNFYLQKSVNDSLSNLATQNVDWTVGDWYRIEVETTTGDDISVEAINTNSDVVYGNLLTNDSEFSDGGWGFSTNSFTNDHQATFDWLRMKD